MWQRLKLANRNDNKVELIIIQSLDNITKANMEDKFSLIFGYLAW